MEANRKRKISDTGTPSWKKSFKKQSDDVSSTTLPFEVIERIILFLAEMGSGYAKKAALIHPSMTTKAIAITFDMSVDVVIRSREAADLFWEAWQRHKAQSGRTTKLRSLKIQDDCLRSWRKIHKKHRARLRGKLDRLEGPISLVIETGHNPPYDYFELYEFPCTNDVKHITVLGSGYLMKHVSQTFLDLRSYTTCNLVDKINQEENMPCRSNFLFYDYSVWSMLRSNEHCHLAEEGTDDEMPFVTLQVYRVSREEGENSGLPILQNASTSSDDSSSNSSEDSSEDSSEQSSISSSSNENDGDDDVLPLDEVDEATELRYLLLGARMEEIRRQEREMIRLRQSSDRFEEILRQGMPEHNSIMNESEDGSEGSEVNINDRISSLGSSHSNGDIWKQMGNYKQVFMINLEEILWKHQGYQKLSLKGQRKMTVRRVHYHFYHYAYNQDGLGILERFEVVKKLIFEHQASISSKIEATNPSETP